ncbi:IS5 family transposase [Leptothrix discophora]|uniref:IS5 family transposase n=1 Tax=Leptothrix discophora TaxID=89 RepID=A0ABT9FXW1_LEPDI|nr:IS5 family transposase [Leptothrix discophora]MDP4299065.1 IS5 family transposase [Leptothrix discophora]
MNQACFGLGLSTKRPYRREFLGEMEQVVPWSRLESPYLPRGRPPVPAKGIPRIHLLRQWFNLSDPAMECALHDVPLFREFVGLGAGDSSLPDESTLLRFRCVLEEYKLVDQIFYAINELLTAKGLLHKCGTVVDAMLIASPSSTKNASGERELEMKQSNKENQLYFGMKCFIGAVPDSGLVHTVRGTAGSVNDGVEANSLLLGDEVEAFGDAGYQGAHKRVDAKPGVTLHVAMRRGKRKLLDPTLSIDALTERIEKLKAGIRPKIEQPFRVIKRQIGYVKIRYRGPAKNTALLVTPMALSNLRMVRGKWSGALA